MISFTLLKFLHLSQSVLNLEVLRRTIVTDKSFMFCCFMNMSHNDKSVYIDEIYNQECFYLGLKDNVSI